MTGHRRFYSGSKRNIFLTITIIDDSAELTVTQIRAKARRLQIERGLGLVIIDYLQLIKFTARLDRRDLEISEISKSLKALAKELKIPVIAFRSSTAS